MTRKRFIKLLGRYGITRNVANEMAKTVLQHSGTYEHGFAYFMQIVDYLKRRIQEEIAQEILYGNSKSAPVGMHDYIMPYQGLQFEERPQEPYACRPLFTMGSTLLHPLPVIKVTHTDDRPAAGGGGS